MDVDLVDELMAVAKSPAVDIAAASYQGVVRGEDMTEELRVCVVEPSPRLGRKALRHPCPGENSEDVLLRVTAWNRGPEPAPLHVLPHAWFRNRWRWNREVSEPSLRRVGPARIEASEAELGRYVIDVEPGAELLFCDNETNAPLLYGVDTKLAGSLSLLSGRGGGGIVR